MRTFLSRNLAKKTAVLNAGVVNFLSLQNQSRFNSTDAEATETKQSHYRSGDYMPYLMLVAGFATLVTANIMNPSNMEKYLKQIEDKKLNNTGETLMRNTLFTPTPEAGQKLEMEFRKEYSKLSLDALVSELCCFQGYTSTAEELNREYFIPHCAKEWCEQVSASAAHSVFLEKYNGLHSGMKP